MEPGWQSDGSLGTGCGTVNLNAAPPAQDLAARLGRWLLPARCLVCGDAERLDAALCDACRDGLPWNPVACPRCALPLPQPAPACGECLSRPPPFLAAQAPLRYAAPVDRLLTAFKFHAGLAEGRLLAALLLERVDPAWLEGIDALVPVPLHRQRLGRRGYNQALELARPLARAWRRPLAHQALRRLRATAPQSELDAQQRRRNLRGAFAAHAAAVSGRRLLLLDDVITTGTTAREAAATLLAAGATEVRVLALARVPARA